MNFVWTFEVRARIPVGKGAWPAIWTLGSSMEWPSCGEIDIMEFYRKHGIPHILANAAWGTDRQWNAKWNSKAIPFIHFLEKKFGLGFRISYMADGLGRRGYSSLFGR